MKVLTHTLLFFTTLFIVIRAESIGHYHIPLYDLPLQDVEQKTAMEMAADIDIQMNYFDDKTIQVRNSSCANENFPIKGNDRTYIRLLFNTTNLLGVWGEFWAGISLTVIHDNYTTNVNWFKLYNGQVTLDPKKEYTLGTVYVGRTLGKKQINQVSLAFFTNSTPPGWFPTGAKDLSMKMDSDCSWITNFKTIHIPWIPHY